MLFKAYIAREHPDAAIVTVGDRGSPGRGVFMELIGVAPPRLADAYYFDTQCHSVEVSNYREAFKSVAGIRPRVYTELGAGRVRVSRAAQRAVTEAACMYSEYVSTGLSVESAAIVLANVEAYPDFRGSAPLCEDRWIETRLDLLDRFSIPRLSGEILRAWEASSGVTAAAFARSLPLPAPVPRGTAWNPRFDFAKRVEELLI